MLKRRQAPGFTLVEALVALALMLTGLASAGIVLGRSIQYERESGTRRIALRLAGSLADELRALARDAVDPMPTDSPALAAWSESATASLPAGSTARIELAPGTPAQYRVTIEWPVAGLGPQRIVLPVTP
jgi:type II secretory pathway pseudopilin PulG